VAKYIFHKGTTAEIRAAFTDPSNGGVDLDPTSLQLVIREPDATVTTIPVGSLTKESVGHYLHRLPLAKEGTYNWRWEASTPIKAVVLPGALDSVREIEF
jgi:hypothetical protein